MRIVLFICFLCCIACKEQSELPTVNPKTNPNLKFFGYTLIDVLWDDPTDNSSKSNYIDEVASFSNLADILVIHPSDDIRSRIDKFQSFELNAVLHLHELFFELVGTTTEKSLVDYDLRADFKQRWDEFILLNEFDSNIEGLACFYLGEEPTWNSISFEDFKKASDYIKQSIPEVPILLVEAYPALVELEIPESIDWIGFDHYFIENPKTDDIFLEELETLREKKKNGQEILLIMDAHYIDWAHGSFNLSIEDMGRVAENYYNLANQQSDIIGMLAYHWPSGFDFPESIGARDFPELIRQTHISIGKEITGR